MLANIKKQRGKYLPLSSGLMGWGFLSVLGTSGLGAVKRNMIIQKSLLSISLWQDYTKIMSEVEPHSKNHCSLVHVHTHARARAHTHARMHTHTHKNFLQQSTRCIKITDEMCYMIICAYFVQSKYLEFKYKYVYISSKKENCVNWLWQSLRGSCTDSYLLMSQTQTENVQDSAQWQRFISHA